ncbi:hypothetical protein Tco_1021024 [Tanacetum coccineum]
MQEHLKGNQVKDDAQATQKTEVPIPSSSISSDYAAKYLNFDNIPPVDVKVVSMLDINVQHEARQATTSTTVVPGSKTLIVLHQRVTDLEKDVKEHNIVDHSVALLSTIKYEVPNAVKEYLGISLDDALHKVLQKHSANITKEHYVPAEIVKRLRQQYVPEKTQKTSQKARWGMQESSKCLNPKQRALYHALMGSILEDEDAMDEDGKQVKDTEPSKKAKSTESSKGTSKSQPKSTGKSAQEEETVFVVGDTQEPHNQRQDKGNTNDQPNVKAVPKHEWFKKPERPLTPDPDWNARKLVDFRPPQTWISKIAKAKKPPLTFDELMSTPIDFSAYFMNNLKIDNLTQDLFVGPAFNLLKGTCKSHMELEYNFKECYKALTSRLDCNNPEGKEYLFDLSKPLPLIMEQGRQVVLADFFFNNDLEYLKSKKYTNLTTKTKAANYDIPGIKDMVPSLWSPIKKLSNLERDVLFDLGVALRMFTRRIVILKRVEDLQLGVESYQKRLKITKPETFRSDISNRIPYTTYSNPQGIIYVDKYKRNRLMRSDELYKFSDGALTSVRSVLHDISLNLRMEYLPNRRWSNLNRQRSRIMIKAIDKMQLERRLIRSLEKFVGGID